ncbi:endo alpha-1,4 polygalactosaminidase [Aspergillus ruber CBS 135680]|uniref:alpha-galactosidase n=1 Tax=Aspergillus ruber (strain CBS 135680) TaxID=1388766 RepID=A0A017S0B8_ASPRC|nr:putative endo alpha-1,4 polygalactosaminidase [Aspergillus ruber CBS 135680]EYE90034.1 putative endo alpha-1,4 polygalactosaminidase [Aspergillus ruber CBS 135680]
MTPMGQSTGGWETWSTKKKLIVLVSALLVLILVLGIALGLGLKHDKEREPRETPPTPTRWQPAAGSTFQIMILYQLDDTSTNADIYDIDLFYNTKDIITQLHKDGRKVLCYFSAGSYEDWRDDRTQFHKSDLGSNLAGWPGERWLDINSENVRRIMLSRLDTARDKGCDGVDPDNVDGYDNHNGLGLTRADAADYVNWLANETHVRDMSMGLKNAGDIIPYVIRNMQWSVNEQCGEYKECDTYAKFIDAGKPVFHIEYPKGNKVNDSLAVTNLQKQNVCGSDGARGFSTVMKNMNLDDWIETC